MAYQNETDVRIFDQIATTFTQLLYGPKDGDKSRILKALDDLNALNYRYIFVTNTTKAILLVNQCVTLIPPDDTTLIPKCCRLITNLVVQQKLIIEGRTLTVTIDWCLDALKQNSIDSATKTPPPPQYEILLALHALLDSAASNHVTDAMMEKIVTNQSPIVTIARQNKIVDECVLLAIQCLVVCCGVKKLPQTQVEVLSGVFFMKLMAGNGDELVRAKLYGASLKGLQNLSQHTDNYATIELGTLLGIVKSYMVYGLRGIDFIVPQKVAPTVLSVVEPSGSAPREKKGAKIAKQRKHRKKEGKKTDEFHDFTRGYVSDSAQGEAASDRLKTSDSDYSDTEGGRVARLNDTQSRVRQAALALLLIITKRVEKRTIFSYWSSLIPDDATTTGTHFLTTCILRDTSPRGRVAALTALFTLLNSLSAFLEQAESSEKTTAFTPFSVQLGLTIKELHRCLSLALNDSSIPVLTQVLKCFATLIQPTPYEKLSPGLITKIVRNVKGFIYHKDATVQVAALFVFNCILCSEPTLPETKEILLKQANQIDNDNDVGQATSSPSTPQPKNHFNIPWLLEKCLNNLTTTETPSPIKIESINIIRVMSRNYFAAMMANCIPAIAKGVECAMVDGYSELRLHAGRAVEMFGPAMNGYFVENEMVDVWTGVQFWLVLLGGPLLELLQDEQSSALRTVACNCLGGVGPKVYERMPADKQITCVTLLFGATRDEDAAVKAAAIRALAIYINYPGLREDTGFVIDTAEAIDSTLKDTRTLVKTKSSWALGNFTDALSSFPNREEISHTLLLRLYRIAIQISQDSNDRIKANGARALANLQRLITAELLHETNFKQITAQTVALLASIAESETTGVKARWNACCGLSSTLHNINLYGNDLIEFHRIFNVLMHLVVNCKNFKVRIMAAMALGVGRERAVYAEFFVPVYAALLRALESTQHVEDFTEYAHKEQLILEIVCAIAHLTTLTTKDDLRRLNSTIEENLEVLRSRVFALHERVVPERAEALEEAAKHVQTRMGFTEAHAQKEVLNALRMLITVFVIEKW